MKQERNHKSKVANCCIILGMILRLECLMLDDFVSRSNDVIVCHEPVLLSDFFVVFQFDVFYPLSVSTEDLNSGVSRSVATTLVVSNLVEKLVEMEPTLND